jgi:hypothetical protein
MLPDIEDCSSNSSDGSWWLDNVGLGNSRKLWLTLHPLTSLYEVTVMKCWQLLSCLLCTSDLEVRHCSQKTIVLFLPSWGVGGSSKYSNIIELILWLLYKMFSQYFHRGYLHWRDVSKASLQWPCFPRSSSVPEIYCF